MASSSPSFRLLLVFQEVLRLLESGSPPNVPGYKGKVCHQVLQQNAANLAGSGCVPCSSRVEENQGSRAQFHSGFLLRLVQTPLMLACGNRHVECATLLLTYGSNVSACHPTYPRRCSHVEAQMPWASLCSIWKGDGPLTLAVSTLHSRAMRS